MVKRQDLHWSDADTRAVQAYKADVVSGKIKPIPLTENIRDLFNK